MWCCSLAATALPPGHRVVIWLNNSAEWGADLAVKHREMPLV
jgi:hypothetical protein